MRVARVAGQEDSVVLVEVISETLADTVRRPPIRVRKIHPVRRKDPACRILQIYEVDVFGARAWWELYVEPHERSAFAWDYQDIARGGVDCAFATDVGEVRLRVDVHDAPDGVGGVTYHSEAERSADGAMGAVATLWS